ncbi:5-deoxy-glucuronate isomerase [Patescibacteria group bacterium AH-259-L05]|nr:5-deoxy-glucuronate isomerase [Patescibacteria group bacterium AH-259-L05]
MENNNPHITDFRHGFSQGYTRLVGLDDVTSMEFGILRLASGKEFKGQESNLETQLVLLVGKGTIEVDGKSYLVERRDLFRTNPWAFDLPACSSYNIRADNDDFEMAVIKTENSKSFTPAVVRPEDVPYEQRGQGQVSGAMHRIVKAIFGDPLAPVHLPESNLVVGEVVNFPGKWSSYPPHGHPQPEIYYYRFDKSQGFGGAFLAERSGQNGKVYELRNHDLVKITNGVGHAQVAAPGYAMWYLWFIRHLEGNRYEGSPPFKFFEEHTWINEPGADEKLLKPEET